ncbi:MAG: type II secretion system GspH family protein [Proteobacteria bacterium]|nr:type II secretion system GspH family protein [Pseudomonadota bacterium]
METLNCNNRQLTKAYTGFTIIEVIIVMTVMGILSAYVAQTSLQIVDKTQEQGELNRLKAHLKYAQTRATNSEGLWGIEFTGNQYQLFRFISAKEAQYFPGEENANLLLTMPKDKSYTGFIWFDSWGRAYNIPGTTLNTATSPISSKLTFVSKIDIEANTGYVHDA